MLVDHTLQFGEIGFGDNVNIIARRQDADQDGILDDALGGTVVGRDFRPGNAGVVTVTFVTVEIQPIGDFDVPMGEDDWSEFISLTFTLIDGTELVASVGPIEGATASVIAPALQAQLGSDFTVVAGEATEDPDTGETDLDPGFLDAVFITYDPNVTGIVGEPIATFTTPGGINAGFGLQTTVDTIEVPTPGTQEDDEIVFRSYQNRFDDESTPDRQASLGREAYAEDLVVGVQDGTTKLVEGQEYRILFDDLKEGDTVSLTLNGKVYSRTVEFEDGTSVSESTESFLAAFAAQINEEIYRDPNGRDGEIFVDFYDPDGATDVDGDNASGGEPSDNTGGLVIREAETTKDSAEHVFIQFPQVSVVNNSGGDAPTWVVRETSDTSVVIYDYDFRSDDSDGLNRGVDVNDQRDGGTFSTEDERFITFEDTFGINRAILQNAEDAGETIEGLDVTAFSIPPGTVDFDQDVFDAGDLVEILIRDGIATTPEEMFLVEIGENVPGNEDPTRGQPDSIDEDGSGGDFTALHGDDLLFGANGTDTILARTGDDRVIASRTATTSPSDRELLDGGKNIVVDSDGVIQEDGIDLLQVTDLDDLGSNELLKFIDTLLLVEGIDSNGTDVFNVGTLFDITVSGASLDGGLSGFVEVDEDGDGDIDHYIDFLNFEVIRTLSDTENDDLVFTVDSDVVYNNAGNQGLVSFDGTLDDCTCVLGVENVTTGAGNDVLIGGTQDEVLDGGAGNDTMNGGAGDDVVNGNAGDDTLWELFSATLGLDDAGDDALSGGAGSDVFFIDFNNGKGGDDSFDGGTEDDFFNLSGNVGGDIGGDLDDDDDDDDDIFDTDTDSCEVLVSDNLDVLFDGKKDMDTISGGLGSDVINIQSLDNQGVVLSFTADDVDNGDETVTLDLTFFGEDFATGDVSDQERVTLTINLSSLVNVTSAGGINDVVAVALQDAGIDAAASGSGVEILGRDGEATDTVVLNDISFGGTLGDGSGSGDEANVLGASVFAVDASSSFDGGLGADEIVDLSMSTVDGVELINLNGGTLIINEDTLAAGGAVIDATNGGGRILVVDGDGDGEVSHGLTSASFVDGEQPDVILVGDDEDETFTGTALGEVILGRGGDDTISALGGDDTIDGGDGDDTVDGGEGDDFIDGDEGDDTLTGGDETIDFATFLDEGFEAGAITAGGSEIDLSLPLTLARYLQLLETTFEEADDDDDDDLEEFELGGDTINGGAGDDTLNGGEGVDLLKGGEDDDTLNGEGDADILFGDAGDDTLFGGDESTDLGDIDETLGDELEVSFASTFPTNQSLFELTPDDFVIEGDVLDGGEGNDALFGGDGLDYLSGGLGRDELTGGDDTDVFIFGELTESGVDLVVSGDGSTDSNLLTGMDVITDFEFAELDGDFDADDDDDDATVGFTAYEAAFELGDLIEANMGAGAPFIGSGFEEDISTVHVVDDGTFLTLGDPSPVETPSAFDMIIVEGDTGLQFIIEDGSGTIGEEDLAFVIDGADLDDLDVTGDGTISLVDLSTMFRDVTFQGSTFEGDFDDFS